MRELQGVDVDAVQDDASAEEELADGRPKAADVGLTRTGDVYMMAPVDDDGSGDKESNEEQPVVDEDNEPTADGSSSSDGDDDGDAKDDGGGVGSDDGQDDRLVDTDRGDEDGDDAHDGKLGKPAAGKSQRARMQASADDESDADAPPAVDNDGDDDMEPDDPRVESAANAFEIVTNARGGAAGAGDGVTGDFAAVDVAELRDRFEAWFADWDSEGGTAERGAPHIQCDVVDACAGVTRCCCLTRSARSAWASLSALADDHASQLCESLRLLLEPTLASRLEGDFKTGKRINIRKACWRGSALLNCALLQW